MFPIRDHNPSQSTPWVTYALIALNVGVFVSYYGLFANEAWLYAFFADWALIPAQLTSGGSWVPLLTSMFLHGGLLHLGGNMLFLYIFGDNLEEAFGRLGFLAFYLACGVAAALAQVLPNPGSAIPMVGASGAIAGVMGGYLLLFPRARVDVLVIIVVIVRVVPLPAFAMLGLWLLLQAVGGFTIASDGGGVAYLAHVGGFAAGVALAAPWSLRQGGPAFWRRLHGAPPHPPAPARLRPRPFPSRASPARSRDGPAPSPDGRSRC